MTDGVKKWSKNNIIKYFDIFNYIKYIYASSENRTQDLQFTRLIQYHYAKETLAPPFQKVDKGREDDVLFWWMLISSY